MGFKTLIKNKFLTALFSMLMLSGTELVMAQDANSTNTATGDQSAQQAGMWTSVSYYVLLFVVVCFAVAVVGKILRVYDLTLQMQRKKGINWNNAMAVAFLLFLILGLAGVYYSFSVQGSMILPEAASQHGKTMDTMFWTTFGITVVVFIATQILLFGFVFYYRNSDKRKGYYLPHNNTIEKAWTIAPAIVLTVLVVFGFFSWRKITNTVDAKGETASINIDVTGHQFAWEIRYPGRDGKLGAKNYKLISGTNVLGLDFKDRNGLDDLHADTLVLPVNKSVRLNILAQDVIHSVYMPNFRVQMNAVPGLPTFFKFTPTITTAEMRSRLDQPDFEYHLYCNKICGGSHYNMQKIVKVVTQAEYYDWLAHQKPYLNDQLKKELKMADATEQKGGENKRLALNN
ncbi:cytochrome c oxidase subunit II [Mucilaginibacter sp. RS28]|uniref:Cytochrome c oxidase subunit 2 n=1 Tax=Mucilaginibacter straminoryzae TaxID=2932774 RepID=A0A9X1X5Q9_9SPHI|nr:cytochrome c oxidase subunit II [Mucilaginibacter straminoryzae]MCJ8211602.1 cytochrome c oxidase subunit II [Mucilaginibacter straminoryzae]